MNRQGQATTEYILMLAIVALLALTVKNALAPVLSGLGNRISAKVDQIWGKGDLHHLRLSR